LKGKEVNEKKVDLNLTSTAVGGWDVSSKEEGSSYLPNASRSRIGESYRLTKGNNNDDIHINEGKRVRSVDP